MITNRIAIVALLLFAFTKPNFAQQTHQFSLQQALEYAEKNNVQVKNALLDIKLQEQVNREVTGSAYPQINASGEIVDNLKLPISIIPAGTEFVPGTPPTTEDTRLAFGVKWSSMGGVTLSQILFDGQIFTGLQARKTLIDYQKKNAEVTSEEIRVNVSKIYYQLVLSKTQISLLDTTINLVKKNRHDTKIMYDNGFVEKLEIDKLDVQLSNLQSQRTQLLNTVNNGYLGLKMLIGMPINDELILTDELNDDTIRDGVLEASQFDYSQRKDFQSASLGLKLSEYDIQRYQRSKIPQLVLNGYWNQMTQANQFGNMFGSGSYWFPVSALTLRLNIPIFNGFATNSRIQQAKIKLQQTENSVEGLKLMIDQERASAVNTFKSAITDMDYQKENMELAERVYQQTKKKHEVGTGSQIEIDAARTDLQTAQTNYYSALYNAVIAKIDFLKASGKL
ncbi:TolC family protein [Niabella ginsengisoli]|uniref:TolC family protein n=1 Tax=Niabella ginsengisoli TaxID=522298 RepID=A0ABS9SDV8_9BACT|nr:TolC family protein [Niabella ginsengisoli]MCH5596544.1 TolC family protein [Niabella ginsengisoli]